LSVNLNKKPIFLLLLISLIFSLAACTGGDSNSGRSSQEAKISGTIEGGLRVLTLDAVATDQHFTIYRGDYVRAQMAGDETFTINIASLDVDKQFPVAPGEKAYFKVPESGSFPFSAGQGQGTIEALEYQASAYQEVTVTEGKQLIANLDPLILDVRTAREYEGGHLPGSLLIPVQEIQGRLAELKQYQDKPILVYCRTGNRSTVAAKVLVDNGFTNVVNLRRGIAKWQKAGFPVEN